MIGQGHSFGAFTILNGALCGIGAAIGTQLRTDAEFSPSGRSKDVVIINDKKEDDRMARICVSQTYKHLGVNEPNGWHLMTRSEIPVSRGMKSSSSACNAIVSAVAESCSYQLDPMEIVKMGVDCARTAKVTVTGAFDDACACHLGGLYMTDNRDDHVIEVADVPDLDVLFCIPATKVRKNPSMVVNASIKKKAESLVGGVLDDPFNTMIDNGVLVSSLMGYDRSIEERALAHDAIAAGVTGFGQAVAILIEKDTHKEFIRESGISPDIITRTRDLI